MFFIVPVAVANYFLTFPIAAGLALLVAAIGIKSILIAEVLQTFIVFGAVEYEQMIKEVLTAGSILGVWLLLTNFVNNN